jgi:DNA-3-methyladenine glycosylase
MKISKEFYLGQDVVKISRELLGKVLCTKFNGTVTSGIIVETEAYAGITDRASHAYGGRRTKRTEVMYSEGGTAYVYLCYGIHHLFNIVTNKKDVPHAVLIRAVKPLEGIPRMLKRRKLSLELPLKDKAFEKISGGPGTVSQALGISTSHTGEKLSGTKIWIEDRDIKVSGKEIISGPRIGVEYAKEDALLPYRFRICL